MTQEKDLLLKDLSARLPYGVIVNVKGFDYDYNDKLTQIYNGVGCSIQVTNNMPYYALGGTCWKYCIPYKENEHLLGTTDDCDEHFKTWK